MLLINQASENIIFLKQLLLSRNSLQKQNMETCYKIDFTADMQKMVLAFKMQCQIQVIWKRGQKIAQTGKVAFNDCKANFNQKLTISCNMVFDQKNKLFKQKTTKFAIVIYTQKGTKQAGQIVFDVAPFLNQRQKKKKYQLSLQKCPDKNAKLYFTLQANIVQKKSFDSISQSSLVSVDIQALTGSDGTASRIIGNQNNSKINPGPNTSVDSLSSNNSTTSIMSKNKQKSLIVPTTDRSNNIPKPQIKGGQQLTDRQDKSTAQKIKQLQIQNKKMREQLKKRQSLIKQNEQLKKRLKEDDYQSCKDYKQKIEAGRKQMEKLHKQVKGQEKLQSQIKKIQKDILKCKQQIMSAFNYACIHGGPKVLDQLQQACGIQQY